MKLPDLTAFFTVEMIRLALKMRRKNSFYCGEIVIDSMPE